MKPILHFIFVGWIAVGSMALSLPAAEPPEDFWRASGQHGVVAAGGRQAADAGIEILKADGNAVDAAVASLLVLTVTDPGNFCFGGEVPILIFNAGRGLTEVVIGLGEAPRLATLEYFQKRGGIPGGGDPTSAAVPGAFGGLITALDQHGTMTFARLARPMLRVLDGNSTEWRPDLARTVRRLIEVEQSAGPDRRRGLRRVLDYFYRGPIARELDEWSRAKGGLLRYSDLATHVTRVEESISIDYRGYTIHKGGPWTQGPFLLETLRLLEGYDLKSLGHNSPQYIHLLIEAMKLGLADRDTYFADPLFVDVPVAALISEAYANLRRPLIDSHRASMEQRPGDPQRMRPLLLADPVTYQSRDEPIHDTTTCVVSDRWGNVVAATPSGWGGVLAGQTGILLNSRLRSFNTWPGHPNCIEPGKRPRITLTPTVVLKAGRPVFAVSVAGGDWQDQVTLQVLLNYLEFGMPPAEGVTAPRFGTHHLVGSFNQPNPELGKLSIYDAVGDEVLEELDARGHLVTVVKPPFWHPVALSLDPVTGWKHAAGDPNAKRHAAAY